MRRRPVFGCEGFYYGIGFNEHFTAQRLGLIYCDTGMYVNAGVGSHHGASVLYASVEVCTHVMWADGLGGAGSCPVFIGGAGDGEYFRDLLQRHR